MASTKMNSSECKCNASCTCGDSCCCGDTHDVVVKPNHECKVCHGKCGCGAHCGCGINSQTTKFSGGCCSERDEGVCTCKDICCKDNNCVCSARACVCDQKRGAMRV